MTYSLQVKKPGVENWVTVFSTNKLALVLKRMMAEAKYAPKGTAYYIDIDPQEAEA